MDPGAGTDTLDLTSDRVVVAAPSASSSSSSREPSRRISYDQLPSSSEWWIRQDRSGSRGKQNADLYTLANDADGDGNVDLYDMSRIDHEHVEMAPPEGARRLDTYGDDAYIYEV